MIRKGHLGLYCSHSLNHYCYFCKDEQCLYQEFKKNKGDEENTEQDTTSIT